MKEDTEIPFRINRIKAYKGWNITKADTLQYKTKDGWVDLPVNYNYIFADGKDRSFGNN